MSYGPKARDGAQTQELVGTHAGQFTAFGEKEKEDGVEEGG